MKSIHFKATSSLLLVFHATGHFSEKKQRQMLHHLHSKETNNKTASEKTVIQL